MNKVLLIAVSAWAAAQVLKVLVILIRERRLDLSYFIASGGMPSAHSATVCALATAVALIEGFKSVAFAIATVLAMVVMYDAAGVRRAVSRQSSVFRPQE